MADFQDALRVTISGLRAQAQRLRLSAENIANADTPGYRRKLAGFEATAGGLVVPGPVRLDAAPLARRHDPANPLADAQGYVEGSNVNLLMEIADAREAQRSYEANLKMFEQTRAMSSALLDLLRR
mgnify:CR=1 FL=1